MGKDGVVDQGLLDRYVASLSAGEVRELALDGLRSGYAFYRTVGGGNSVGRRALAFKEYAEAEMSRALDGNGAADESEAS